MKVCQYQRESTFGAIRRLGIFFNSSLIIDVNYVWQLYFESQGFFNARERANNYAPAKLSTFLKLKENPIDNLKETIQVYEDLTQAGHLKTKNDAYTAFDLRDDKSTKLLSPIDEIHCYRDFYAHEKHVKKGFELRKEPVPEAWYEIPAYYKGSTKSFIGHDEIIAWPEYSEKLDYELELGVVISRDGHSIKAKDAMKHVFGFTILNDISARDIQKKEMSIRLGPAKGKDFCSILGPVITTADEFNFDEPNLHMQAFINGEQWSEGYSGDSHYSWSEMIEHASRAEWLMATDLLGSGTVGTGCGLELNRWIQPGDKIELEIEKIGKLKNLVGVPGKN